MDARKTAPKRTKSNHRGLVAALAVTSAVALAPSPASAAASCSFKSASLTSYTSWISIKTANACSGGGTYTVSLTVTSPKGKTYPVTTRSFTANGQSYTTYSGNLPTARGTWTAKTVVKVGGTTNLVRTSSLWAP